MKFRQTRRTIEQIEKLTQCFHKQKYWLNYAGPGSLTPLAPISMQDMKLSTGTLLDHPSFQGKTIYRELNWRRVPMDSRIFGYFTRKIHLQIVQTHNALHSSVPHIHTNTHTHTLAHRNKCTIYHQFHHTLNVWQSPIHLNHRSRWMCKQSPSPFQDLPTDGMRTPLFGLKCTFARTFGGPHKLRILLTGRATESSWLNKYINFVRFNGVKRAVLLADNARPNGWVCQEPLKLIAAICK